MFKPEDFEIPLEAQLKLRVMADEVNECKDVKVLQENLINTSTLLVRYQQILNSTLKAVIEKEILEIDAEFASKEKG